MRLPKCIVLLGLVCKSLSGDIFKENDGLKQLEFSVESSWKKSPFSLTLVESIAGVDESLYEIAALSVMGINSRAEDENYASEESSNEGEDGERDGRPTDEQLYERSMSQLKLDEVSKALINFNIVYKTQTPRIASQYDYYQNTVTSEYQSILSKKCATDSFGRPVLSGPDDYHRAWVISGKNFYCTPDDLFALKVSSSSITDVLPFDRIIGVNQDAPILVLYGDVESKSFTDMFAYLYKEAQNGKLRFIWRYIPPQGDEKETMCGYGVDLSFKKYNHLVESSTSEAVEDELRAKHITKGDLERLLNIPQTSPKPISKAVISDLGTKLTALILNEKYDCATKLDMLTQIVQNFPSFASHIGNLNDVDVSNVSIGMSANDEKGVTVNTFGLYFNGSPLKKFEVNIYKVVEKIREEINLVRRIKDLGFSIRQTKLLLRKFALMAGVKQQYFRRGNNIMGSNENRHRIGLHEYSEENDFKGGVVFFNNLEKDPNYDLFISDRREAYLGDALNRLRPGQIPSLKENVHDLIFAINFADKNQLKVFFVLSKVVLDRSIPQQIGIIGLSSDDPMDKILADRFYHIAKVSQAQEAFAFLYKYYESTSPEERDTIIDSIKITDNEIGVEVSSAETLRRFSISSPSIIFNGVIHLLSSKNWQSALNRQLTQDVKILQSYIKSGSDTGRSLKSMLLDNAKDERNLRIIPSDPSSITYKKVDKTMITDSIALRKSTPNIDTLPLTIWIIGDLSNSVVLDQLKMALRYMSISKSNLQVRILSTTKNSITRILDDSLLDHEEIELLLEKLENTVIENYGIDESTQELLSQNLFPSGQNFMLLNSRYLRLDLPFSVTELQQLEDYENSQRLDILSSIIQTYKDEFNGLNLLDFKTEEHNLWDWYDLLSTELTASFYTDQKAYSTENYRFDLTSLNTENSFNLHYDENKEVDVWLVIDPISEDSQKMLSFVNFISNFPGINTKVIMQPRSLGEDETPIERYYSGVLPISTPKFDTSGSIVSPSMKLKHISLNSTLTANLDAPQTWQTIVKHTPWHMDLDNILMSEIPEETSLTVFEIKNIVVEGFASENKKFLPPAGLEMELSNSRQAYQSSVMSNLGYFQFRVSPGLYDFHLAKGNSFENFSITSVSENYYIFTRELPEKHRFFVSNLNGAYIYPRVSRKTDIQKSRPQTGQSRLKGLWQSMNTRTDTENDSDINVFSIASGHLYEHLLNIMALSIVKHTERSVKFWIIDDFVSPQFRSSFEQLSEIYGFKYEYITYKWPTWLRSQRQKYRTIWAFKILFLDVLFPLDLKRVIFVDADQVARADMMELVELDLQDKPYGFVPMCESKEEMKGYRFWEEGYWAKVLEGGLKYHISALFVVDLEKFRSISAGNMLRSHYQKLSSDPNSLSNLDQDLPNNFQHHIPIFSLPQEWLWCETWCSDESLSSAKTIDLCNNPLTKENKLQTAKRVIPEWIDYDEEIRKLENDSVLQEHTQETFSTEILDAEDDHLPIHDEL